MRPSSELVSGGLCLFLSLVYWPALGWWSLVWIVTFIVVHVLFMKHLEHRGMTRWSDATPRAGGIVPGGRGIEYPSSTVVKMSKQPRYQRWKHRTHPTIKAVYDLHIGKCAPFNTGEIRDRMMARLVNGEQITALGWDDATNYEPEEQASKSPEAPGKHSFLVEEP